MSLTVCVPQERRLFAHCNSFLYVSTHLAQTFFFFYIHWPTATFHHRETTNQQTGNGQRGRGSCSLRVDSALLLGGSLLSTRPGPRQLHTGLSYFNKLIINEHLFSYKVQRPVPLINRFFYRTVLMID